MTAGRLVHGFGCKAFWDLEGLDILSFVDVFLRIFGCHVEFVVSLRWIYLHRFFYKGYFLRKQDGAMLATLIS